MSANGANDPALSSPWHLSCTLGVTLRLSHYTSLDQPSSIPRYQHGGKTDSSVIEVICGGWLRAVYVIDAFISEHRSSTSITEDLYLEIRSKYLYYPRVQCDHVSPHCPVSPTIVTLTANYASITGPVSGRRKGREQRDEYKLCFVRGDCCGCGVLSSVPAACRRVSP